MALAVAATIAGAVAGAGLGALLAAAIARHHAARVQEQLKKGGLVLWVSVPHPDAEKRALAVLEKMGARHIHVHDVKPEWSLSDIPFATTQPDPFPGERQGIVRIASVFARVGIEPGKEAGTQR